MGKVITDAEPHTATHDLEGRVLKLIDGITDSCEDTFRRFIRNDAAASTPAVNGGAWFNGDPATPPRLVCCRGHSRDGAWVRGV